ncbi:glucose 1-dehydrogenase [Phyllobacterium myrsinacearum]|uniref:Meso-butanediol dehydrogenase/(S,S)-butanediol dehydrogenase/diacetyl reductase n=1 Tax=Phyllobacterium myrsinacearum TaxID=28101 RepID=A0A839ERL6_9HYPH|nr:meso-butanediol dehydrogenase/(S,S)-butanediol dehydrogenase/diacetyl reductase [Phyllobacterium myrsinacearum]
MSNSVKDRSIIVTGSARGIGEAIARGLALEGARLTIADINEADAKGVAKSIADGGGRAIGIGVDVTKRASIKAMIAATVSEFGRLDVMFNNAGIAQVRPFLDITEDDWHRVMDVNGLGGLIGIQEAVRQMIAQGGGGKIINTASIAGRQGYEPLAHYSASKFSVVALTQAAARAFGQHKINVNAICPGVVATDMWKLIDKGFKDEGLTKRDNEAFEDFSAEILLGRPSIASDLIGISQFLASAGSDYVTGQSIVVDGGMMLI